MKAWLQEKLSKAVTPKICRAHIIDVSVDILGRDIPGSFRGEIRTLLMNIRVPIYAASSWTSIVSLQAAQFLDPIRDIYEVCFPDPNAQTRYSYW